MANDIIKSGYLTKLKTMKKKYFVLRNQSGSGAPARLEYYDGEKKFRSNPNQPKWSMELKSCFSINRKVDAKHKFAIALYTRDDCFAVVADDEPQLNEWLNAMLELQAAGCNDHPKFHRTHYDYVWQVNIMKNGLGQSRNMTGVHRLCLNANAIYIVKVNPQQDQPDSYEFPLINIRRCAHASNVSAFMIELGRLSSIGPGELWIQAEDATVAHHMHEVIIGAMKSSKTHDDLHHDRPQPLRQRSSSTGEHSKMIVSSRPQKSSMNQPVIANVPSHGSTCASSSNYTVIRERCDSLPTQPRTNSKTHTQCPNTLSDHRSHHINMTTRTQSYSPPNNTPLKFVSVDSLASSRRSSGTVDKNASSDDLSEYVPMMNTPSGLEMGSSGMTGSSGLEMGSLEEKSDSYMNMTPISSSLPKTDAVYLDAADLSFKDSVKEQEFHLDKVKSYFASSGDDSAGDYIKPVRAYSIGSRPQLAKSALAAGPKMYNQSKTAAALAVSSSANPNTALNHDDSHRVRAYSVGSHTNSRHVRVTTPFKSQTSED